MGGLFVTGTDTGVGKTVVTAALVAALRARGLPAAAMKPVQTGHSAAADLTGDAAFLHRAAGGQAPPALVCPLTLRDPLAPAAAAEREGREVEPGELVRAFAQLARQHDPLLVEGVGGLAVPLRGHYLVADLARELGLPLLVVARPALGTLNHTLLTVAYARQRGLTVWGVVVSYAAAARGLAEESARPWLERLTGLSVWEFPHLPPGPDGYPPPADLARAGEELLDQIAG